MKFAIIATTVPLILSIASGLTPTKTEEVQVDKRVQYTIEGLVSELIHHGIFDTLSLFTNLLGGGILTETD